MSVIHKKTEHNKRHLSLCCKGIRRFDGIGNKLYGEQIIQDIRNEINF
jgi:hypothetical protein